MTGLCGGGKHCWASDLDTLSTLRVGGAFGRADAVAATRNRSCQMPSQINRKFKPASRAAASPAQSPKPTVDQHEEAAPRTTKQELVLTLLRMPKGASAQELMTATGWQIHSVRGFLAGTVKKKLGFDLTSAKAEGEERRYRVQIPKRR